MGEKIVREVVAGPQSAQTDKRTPRKNDTLVSRTVRWYSVSRQQARGMPSRAALTRVRAVKATVEWARDGSVGFLVPPLTNSFTLE